MTEISLDKCRGQRSHEIYLALVSEPLCLTDALNWNRASLMVLIYTSAFPAVTFKVCSDKGPFPPSSDLQIHLNACHQSPHQLPEYICITLWHMFPDRLCLVAIVFQLCCLVSALLFLVFDPRKFLGFCRHDLMVLFAADCRPAGDLYPALLTS